MLFKYCTVNQTTASGNYQTYLLTFSWRRPIADSGLRHERLKSFQALAVTLLLIYCTDIKIVLMFRFVAITGQLTPSITIPYNVVNIFAPSRGIFGQNWRAIFSSMSCLFRIPFKIAPFSIWKVSEMLCDNFYHEIFQGFRKDFIYLFIYLKITTLIYTTKILLVKQ